MGKRFPDLGVKPTQEQQQIMGVVCSLTNLLMKDMQARGSGQTTLRCLIAQRIIDEDTGYYR